MLNFGQDSCGGLSPDYRTFSKGGEKQGKFWIGLIRLMGLAEGKSPAFKIILILLIPSKTSPFISPHVPPV
jgi:hypothetical protein